MSEKNISEENIEFGMALVEKEEKSFKTEAIQRFQEFDRITNSVSPGNNWYTIGYATIVATMKGEIRVKEIEMANRAEEASAMVGNLSSVLAGFGK